MQNEVLLWSPNHKFEEIGFSASAHSSCEGSSTAPVPAVNLNGVTVWSDETEVPVAGDGSGNTSPDARVNGTSVQLRSERRGTEDGRVYLMIANALDEAGNTAHACCTVVVPHSKSGADVDDVRAQAAAARAYCQATGAPPAGFTQHGVGRAMNRSGNEDKSAAAAAGKSGKNTKTVKAPKTTKGTAKARAERRRK